MTEKLEDPALKKALNVLDVMNFDPEEREAYEEHLKWLRIEANTLKKYEAKGFSEGKAEGKLEEKFEIARNLLEKKLAISLIAEATGLTEAQIKEIAAANFS